MYYLDTNTCIYFLKGIYPELLIRLKSHAPNDIKISAIVKAELLLGVEKSVKRDENMAKIEAFLLPFEIVQFGDEDSSHYASIRASLEAKGTPIGPNDLFIAATVKKNNGILITNNIREFSRVEGLRLENWT